MPGPVAALEACRRAEKEQALFYRTLAVAAEEQDPDLASRFHDLHADEQHHLSRLTARLVELGRSPGDLDPVTTPEPGSLADWESAARAREVEEVARYERLLETDLDGLSRALIEEIVEVERRHADELGGKWTMA